ncbi:MAG: hypothetical protein WA977_13560 [Halobacteriota archaeon]
MVSLQLVFFAELRCDSEAAKLECVEYPACHLAAHRADFSAIAICLILRCCGSGVGGVERNAARSSAWQALH